MNRVRWMSAMGIVLVALGLAALPGCAVGGFMAQALLPDKVKAQYALADRPTLVLVEDPNGALGDQTMTGVIAGQVAHCLQQEGVVKQCVDQARLHEVAQRLGDQFATTPVDQVGREAGAQQVVHVYVAAAAWYPEPGSVRPSAAVQVKVIDAAAGKRLFPALTGDNALPGMPPAPGVTVRSTMAHKMGGAEGDRGLEATLRRELAERIGRDVARLFYDYDARAPGE